MHVAKQKSALKDYI